MAAFSRTARVRGHELQRRRAAWFAAHPLCVTCESKGITKLAQELDHKIPLHQGGSDDPSNWQGLCRECHADKSITERGDKRRPKIGNDGWPE